MPRRWARSVALIIAVVAAACRSDGSTPPPDASLSLTGQSGALLTGPAGARLLGVPLVLVTDAALQPVSGVVVTLALTSGASTGFALPETKVVSGPDGLVRSDVVLGAAGDAVVRATTAAPLAAEATVTVTATAAPALATVSPTTFGAGDEVTLTGSDLPSASAGTTVLVGGVPATILAASATTLRVIAPACVTAGPVTVAVRLPSGATTNAVTASYTTSMANPGLAVHEAITVSAGQVAQCLSLEGNGARYLVVPQYATSDAVGSVLAESRPPFALGANVSGAPVASVARAGGTLTAQGALDRMLRQSERALAPLAARSGAHPPVEAPLAALTLNSTRSFKVLNTLDGGAFDNVTARLKFIGDNVLIYVDQTAPANGLSDARLTGLGNLFDRKLYDAAADAFGSPTDIDKDDHVIVLMTPTVNKMTTAAECTTIGYVTGFFYGLDLSALATNSNKGEIFYSIVADPSGATGSCAHTVAEVERQVPATFIHELQHMISYGQHVLVRGGPDEELWLNEGLSHVAEELGSLLYERDPGQPRSTPAQIFPDSSQGFINGDMRNAYTYLRQPTNTSVTLTQGGGTLEERGAAWLFLRWLGDQKGDAIFRRLVETSLTGVRNVEDKAGEPFARMFGDFSIAAYAYDGLSGVPDGALPERYRFLSRDFRLIFKRFFDVGGEDFDRAFPIVAAPFAPGTSVFNSMVPGTATWYELRTGTAPRVTLNFGPNGGAGFDPALGAQVTVLRLQPTP
ncbi:MAG: IPT/TIG domain-containing protein [Gemmatimonadaceae bacterium]